MPTLGASVAAGRSTAMTGPGVAPVIAVASATAGVESTVGAVAVSEAVAVAGAGVSAAGACYRDGERRR